MPPFHVECAGYTIVIYFDLFLEKLLGLINLRFRALNLDFDSS